MKAAFVTLLISVLWAPFYVNAAEDGRFPAINVKPTENKSSEARAGVAIAGQVTRAQFTSDVRDHEPVDNILTLGNDKTRICYFTEIVGMAGQTVMHRWEYKGKVLLEMPFKVGSSRWRAYSIKTLDPSWLGEWKASLVDATGSSLSVNTFTYMKKTDSGSSDVQTPPAATH